MTRRESGNDRLTCRVSGSEAVTQASTAARTFGEAQWLSDDEAARLCIIIEELVANLYDHGGVGGDDEVTLSFASEPAGIFVTILDRGKAFDPRQLLRKTDPGERGGGAGIDIVRSWAMITGYQSSADGNRLDLILPLSS